MHLTTHFQQLGAALAQIIAVFDADHVAQPHFFTRTLPWMQSGCVIDCKGCMVYACTDKDAMADNDTQRVLTVFLDGFAACGQLRLV